MIIVLLLLLLFYCCRRHHYHHLHHTLGCSEHICPVFVLSSLIANSENTGRVRLCHVVYKFSVFGPQICKLCRVLPGVDGRIILRLIFRKWDGGMDWIDLAQDRTRWRALVNAVMKIWDP